MDTYPWELPEPNTGVRRIEHAGGESYVAAVESIRLEPIQRMPVGRPAGVVLSRICTVRLD